MGIASSDLGRVHVTVSHRLWAMDRGNRTRWIVAATIYCALLVVWVQYIDGTAISGDDIATAVPAVHLQHDGVIALKERNLPTMYREPLPILTTAIAVGLTDAFLGPAAPSEYLEGDRARWLKLQNVLWLTVLCVASFYVALRLTSSFTMAIGVALLSHAIFLYPIGRGPAVNTLYTEIPAAALLVPASWFFAVGIVRRDKRALAIAGVVCGLTALVKASMLYIVIGLVIVIAAAGFWRKQSNSPRSIAAELAAFVLTFAAVVAPWMYRNWVQFETVGIAERGGLALYFRALYNDVDAVEYKGLFYVWAPGPLAPAVGRILSIAPSDLEPGGALFRLNSAQKWQRINVAAERAGRPERATSVIGEARAERVKVRNAFAAVGAGARVDILADNWLRDRALAKMREKPLNAFAVTFPVLWRGGALILPLLLFVAVHSLVRRRYELLSFCLIAAALTAFYALFTMFELRYGVPITVVALVAAGIAAHGELTRIRIDSARNAHSRFLRWIGAHMPTPVLSGSRRRR